jgi:hypothetical protein
MVKQKEEKKRGHVPTEPPAACLIQRKSEGNI